MISGWYGNANVGDEAILTAILQALHTNIPALNITVFSDEPASTHVTHAVQAMYHPVFPLSRQTWPSYMRSRRPFREALAALKRADLFVLGGGGLLHDYHGAVYPWLWEVLLAKAVGTPVALYALGIGPLRRRLAILLTRALLGRVDLITVRDPQSKALLHQIGIRHPPTTVTADPAVLLEPLPLTYTPAPIQKMRSEATDGPLVGVSLRPWFAYLTRDPAVGRDAERQFEALVAQMADRWIDQLGARIVFVPFHAGDIIVCRNVLSAMTHAAHARLISDVLTPQEWISVLGMMDIVAGMRLHALVLAAAAGVPVIGIQYDPKIASFLQTIGQDSFHMDVARLDVEQGVSVLQEVWQQREKVRLELQHRIGRLRQKALHNSRLVAEMIEACATNGIARV